MNSIDEGVVMQTERERRKAIAHTFLNQREKVLLEAAEQEGDQPAIKAIPELIQRMRSVLENGNEGLFGSDFLIELLCTGADYPDMYRLLMQNNVDVYYGPETYAGLELILDYVQDISMQELQIRQQQLKKLH
jgi:hypothetical protein